MILAEEVNLRFRSRELRRLCNQRTALTKRWGAERAAALTQRLQELDAVERLGDMELLPYIRVRSDDAKGEVIVHASDGVRIRLAIASRRHDSDGEAPWKDSTEAVIVDVEVADKK